MEAACAFSVRDEYDRLRKVIAERFPEHVAEFVASVHTGMRLTEIMLPKRPQPRKGS